MSNEHNKMMPIAIVGASAIFPGSPNLESFWNNIFAGNSLIQTVPRSHWLKEDYYQPEPGIMDKVYAYTGAFLPDTPFDPAEFGIPPKLLTSIDTAQLFALIATRNLLKDVKSMQQEKIDRKKIGVILGVAAGTELMVQMSSRIQRPIWAKVLREAGLSENKIEQLCADIANHYVPWNEATFPGLLSNVVAGRVANRFDLGGTNCVIDAACASSLASLKMAVAELRLREADLIITGGVDTFNEIFMYMCFSQTPALSVSGNCRPFSAEADGTVLGEGVGLIALRRLEDAEKDGDRIYAVINSIGSSSDGKMNSIYAPSSQGQAVAVERAYAQVKYSLAEVDLVEAHGTGTKAGDIAEFNGLKLAFDAVPEKQFCALGSIKSQIGHTKSTAGAASILKIIMALNHKILPPTINVNKPNPNLALKESAFYLNTRARPWLHSTKSTRKASVSSFGFGGSNFHVTLEEYCQSNNKSLHYYSSPVHLLLVSAPDQTQLFIELANLRTAARSLTWPAFIKNLQLKFSASRSCRLAILATDVNDCLELLNQFEKMLKKSDANSLTIPGKIYYSQSTNQPTGKIAFLFPGQGSQYLNMTADLAMLFEVVRQTYDDALTLAHPFIEKLLKLIFPIPVFSAEEEKKQLKALTQTEWAQPALGLTSVALFNLLNHLGVHADCYAGHSYGELTALYAAGVFDSLADFLVVSHERGNLMATASTSNAGAMLAVFSDETTLRDLITEKNITWANINSNKQIVLSGDGEIITRIETLLAHNNINFKKLNVAAAFHSSHVSSAAQQFHDYLRQIKFNKPTKPVYANATAKIYPKTSAALHRLLANQLANPVLFKQQLLQMYADGVRTFVEIGPGSILTSFVADTLPAAECISVSFNRKGQNGLATFWDALAKLAVAGIAVDFRALWKDFYCHESSDSRDKNTKTTIMINGANVGKPYPSMDDVTDSIPMNKTITTTVELPEVKLLSDSMSAADTVLPLSSLNEGDINMSVKMPANINSSEWLAAFQTLQTNMLEAQRSFQTLLLQSHAQFLQTSELFLQQLGGTDMVSADNITKTVPVAVKQTLPSVIAMPPAPIIAPTQHQELINEPVARGATAQSVVATAPVITPPVVIEQTSQLNNVSPTTAPLQSDHQSLLLKVVADKTGYPQEMLELNMDLESDLGIDSIKRVEILSALQTDIPELKKADVTELSSLRTLTDILNYAKKLGVSISDVNVGMQREAISEKKLVGAV